MDRKSGFAPADVVDLEVTAGADLGVLLYQRERAGRDACRQREGSGQEGKVLHFEVSVIWIECFVVIASSNVCILKE